MSDAVTQETSPFHEGERQVQERLGVRDQIEAFARRVVRDHMPDQHRAFHEMLPFLLLGTLDARGRPWASLLAGRPGFVTSPDARTLKLAAQPLFGDPLRETLKPGADVGLLGIQLETRRRNRLTGRVEAFGPEGFTIAVRQTFGNCPQYIQSRAVEVLPQIDSADREWPVERADHFDTHTRALIEAADTLFIATAYTAEPDDWSHGADVSHRGGKPGFVKVEDERTFVFPDFSGNNHFNSVGNILLNPKAGFLFVDFEAGELVTMTGAAEIVWSGEEVRAFVGAQRLIRFRAEEVIRIAGGLPLRFDFEENSPMLERTGSWAQTAENIASRKQRDTYIPYEIVEVQPESESITSFYLQRADGRPLVSYEPGQFLPLRLTIPGQAEPVLRSYTLSDGPDRDRYRLSIKREGGEALVSNFLHDHAKAGFALEAMAPRGKFVLDPSGKRPVVLLSAGVGITPMIAMANAIVDQGLRTRKFRRTYFIHGARDGRSHAFGDQIRQLAAEHETFSAHIRYSAPGSADRLGVTHDSEGHVDIALLKALLPFDDFDFYLCGPQPFMRALYDGLIGLGVREDRIHYESFGPATLLKRDAEPTPRKPSGEAVEGPVAVKFTESDIEAVWTPDKGTLLDLAEASGLSPAFSCRTGICGTCATRMACGQVDYIEEPSAPAGDDEVLICCSTPRSSAGEATCGGEHAVVLAL